MSMDYYFIAGKCEKIIGIIQGEKTDENVQYKIESIQNDAKWFLIMHVHI